MTTCGTCRYRSNGDCYRYPPALLPNVDGDASCVCTSVFWDRPTVDEDEPSCGEYRPIEVKP